MKLKQLELLIAIEQEKGLLSAAAKMNVTAPAVTKSIANLEEYFGVELLDRSGYRTVLNEYGQRLAQHCKIISAELEEARHHLQTMKDRAANLVRINASPGVLPRLLPEAIVKLRAELPGASVSFEGHLVGKAKEKLDGLLKGEYDILINVVDSNSDLSGFHYEKLADMQLKVVVAKNHPLCEIEAPTIKDICEYTCLVPGAMEGLPFQTKKRVFSDNKQPLPKDIVSLPTREMVFSLLYKGPYIAMLPYHENLFEGDLNKVQILNVEGIDHGWSLYMLKRKTLVETIPIKTFSDILKQLVTQS